MRRFKTENGGDENFLLEMEDENYLPRKKTIALQRRRSIRLFKTHNDGDFVNSTNNAYSLLKKTKRLRHSFTNNNSCENDCLNIEKV